MEFIKRNLYLLLGVLCVIALGGLYIYNREKPSAVIETGNVKVIYSTDEATVNPDALETRTGTIKVYITGAVMEPGVYEVPENARVDDVLQKAGGPTEEADLLRINLAAYVTDAQRIIVPVIGNKNEYEDNSDVAAVENSDSSVSDLVNINTAGEAALQTLPGIGPVIAKNIIDYRAANGNFTSIEDIKKVNRIGDATFNNIKDKITVN